MNSPQEKYKQICAQHPEIPIFLQAWWLEAASPEHWNVLFYEEKQKVLGFLVYTWKKKWGQVISVLPTLTPFGGVYLFDSPKKGRVHEYAFQNKALNHLIDQLEEQHLGLYEQHFYSSLTNWQPFYWKGYQQTTHYTYQLHHLKDTEQIWENLSHHERRQRIKKGQGMYTLSTEMGGEEFYDFFKNCLQKKGKKIFYSKETFMRLYQAAEEHQQGKILALYDQQQRLNAAHWIVWDQHAAYNMIGAIDLDTAASGASTSMIWEVLQFAKDKTENYDFEGSMIHGVALRNQSYGAVAVPYSCIWKIKNPLLKLWYYWKKNLHYKETK